MFKVNRKVEYALMALKYMVQKHPGELTTAKEVSDRFHTSEEVMAKVLQSLTKHKMLQSVQGVQGGYLIQKDLSRVTFLQLNEILIGRSTATKCLQSDGDQCELKDNCNIISPMHQLNNKINLFLSSLTIDELIGLKKTRVAEASL